MTKTWVDFLSPFDREMAERDPAYADALRKSFAGQIAELKAAAHPLGEPVVDLVRQAEGGFRRIRDALTERWLRDRS